jgi:FkbM family methyltransferase
LFNQFPLLDALRITLVEAMRKILEPNARFSYGSGGGDIHILQQLGWKKEGFYVDVGCNHPSRISNTFILYKAGWRGLCIDANCDLIRMHNRLRPLDKNICSTVSDRVEERIFTYFDDSAVSSISQEHVSEWKMRRSITREEAVVTTTLGRILKKQNAPRKFDLLKIDVEGHDYAVLSALDLNEYRPHLIVVEMKDFDIQKPYESRIFSYLIENE